MNNKEGVSLLAAAMGWGASLHTTQDGPLYILNSDEFKQSAAADWESHILLSAISVHERKRVSTSQRYNLVYNFNYHLSRKIATLVKESKFPVVLGGDHSIAMGTWSGIANGLNKLYNFGLIWIDAHMDAHTPYTSITKSPHGMPIAFLLNQSEHVMKISDKHIINPAHLFYIGVRDFEPEEQQLLQKLGVKVYYMEDIKRLGLHVIKQEILTYFEQNGIDFGISIDLDAFNPSDTPATGIHVPNGIKFDDFIPIFEEITKHQLLKGVEIVEFDPTFEEENKTTKAVMRLLDIINITRT